MECPKTSNKNPVKAIRMKCKDCMGGSAKRVADCDDDNCALHPFRSGKNPFRQTRELSDDEKAKMRENLKKAREMKN